MGSLEEMLDNELCNNISQYSPNTIERVRKFVRYEEDNPGKQRVWDKLEEISDLVLYKNLHLEWKGLTIAEINDLDDRSAYGFYKAAIRWIKSHSKTEEQYDSWRKMLFPRKRLEWEGYATFEDWKIEFDKHPEWQGRYGKDMKSDEKTGAKFFYAAFNKWVRQTTSTEEERDELRRKLFPLPERNDWSHVKTLEDWQKLYSQHPEWQKYSVREITCTKCLMHEEAVESGATAAYVSFMSWIDRTASTKEERKKMRETLFPNPFNDWTGFNTLEDWVEEFEKHPEWKGHKIKQLRTDIELGASAYYERFAKWVRENFKTKKERDECYRKVFDRTNTNKWTYFDSIKEFEEEFKNHPEWAGYSAADMQHDNKSKANSFYARFIKWANKNAKDEEQKKEWLSRFFERRHEDWLKLETIAEWIDEFKRHEEWRGYSASDMREDVEFGACNFYQALTKWMNKNLKTKKEVNDLKARLFPSIRPKYQFEDKIVRFDSNDERLIAVLLDKYGLFDLDNIHVKTNGIRQHSIDFLVGENLIEYHPLQAGDAKLGIKTPEEAGKRKLENITNSAYFGNNFFHFWKLEQLFDVLSGKIEPTVVPGAKKEVVPLKQLMKPEYQNLTREDFKKHLKEARQKIWAYDQKIRTLDNVVEEKAEEQAIA